MLDTAKRTPPCNFEAEKALLGAIMANNKAYHKSVEALDGKLKGFMFADPLHGLLFDEMARMINAALKADPITLAEGDLNNHPQIVRHLSNQPGWGKDTALFNEWIVELAASAVTIINATEYARIIAELHTRRELLQVADNIYQNIYHYEGDDDDVVKRSLEDADKSLLDIAESSSDSRNTQDIGDHMHDALMQLDAAHRGKGLMGVSTGLDEVDDILSGLNKSDLIVLAGRPSMGKTALALNMASKAAAEFDKDPKNDQIVLFFSLEMSGQQLAGRYLSSEAEVDGDKARKGLLANDEFMKLVMANERLKTMPMKIDDESDGTVSGIRSSARRLSRKRKVGLIIVDYLQLLNGEGKGSDTRVNEVSKITRGLKLLAKELEVPVVALSQLSRKVEERENKRPRLPDLRESGSIEQDADVVMFVYRDCYYVEQHLRGETDVEKSALLEHRLEESLNEAEVIIAKNRHGKLGVAHVRFEGQYSKFSN